MIKCCKVCGTKIKESQTYCGNTCVAREYRKRNSKKVQERYKFWHLNNTYSISKEEYLTLFESQNGCCSICKTKLSIHPDTDLPQAHLDHCHTTGKIRGLLCPKCNKGLGHFKDNPEFLLEAVAYLRKFL